MPKDSIQQANDAARLKLRIQAWQEARKSAGLPSSYMHLGAMVGGISQSSVSQYANGDIPLNARALELFASALGVSPESISKDIAVNILAHSNARQNLRGLAAPGMVYTWVEVQGVLSDKGPDKLPDILSVEVLEGSFSGLVTHGDALVLSRLDDPNPGDGILIQHADGRIEVCIYRPGTRGDFYAQGPDGTLLHSVGDSIRRLFTVVGMPTLRWSRLVR